MIGPSLKSNVQEPRVSQPNKICRTGELCGDVRHIFENGVYVPCSCFYIRRRDNWFLAGGFAPRYIGLTSDIAIKESKCDRRTPAELRLIARRIGMGQIRKPLLIETRQSEDPMPIGAYLAYQLAIVHPVYLATIAELVEEQFDDSAPLSSAVKSVKNAVVLRMGADQRHSYTGAILQQVIIRRSELGVPTVVMIDRPLDSVEGIYTAAALVVLRTRCVRY